MHKLNIPMCLRTCSKFQTHMAHAPCCVLTSVGELTIICRQGFGAMERQTFTGSIATSSPNLSCQENLVEQEDGRRWMELQSCIRCRTCRTTRHEWRNGSLRQDMSAHRGQADRALSLYFGDHRKMKAAISNPYEKHTKRTKNQNKRKITHVWSAVAMSRNPGLKTSATCL